LLKVDKVDRVALAPYTLATKSKGRSTFGQQSRPHRHRRQSRPYRQQSRLYRRQLTLSPICRRFRQQSTLSAVCTGLKSLTSIVTIRRRWI